MNMMPATATCHPEAYMLTWEASTHKTQIFKNNA